MTEPCLRHTSGAKLRPGEKDALVVLCKKKAMGAASKRLYHKADRGERKETR